jgi:hypothetical protein
MIELIKLNQTELLENGPIVRPRKPFLPFLLIFEEKNFWDFSKEKIFTKNHPNFHLVT